MNPWTKEITLEGANVKLIPLELSHKEALLNASSDGKLWGLWYTSVPSAETIDTYLDKAFKEKEAGIAKPFAVIDKGTKKIIGSTRFYDMQPHNLHLDIGYTWYAKSYQKIGVNTACKYLMLQYAFETLNCIAVQFLTDWHNLNSRKAIQRLGAKQDGILRNHRVNADGSYRDSVVFSITDVEWKGVKKSLEYKLKHYK